MAADIFPLIIFNARPGAGKSELTQALLTVPLEERISRFHIGPLHIIDDFPMLWRWFEQDQLLEEVFNRPRLHTTTDGYFLHHDLWHLLIRQLSLEAEKCRRDDLEPHTIILEFSRGAEHGGYQAAYEHLSNEVLEQAACLYLRVSYAESVRKNSSRYNPDRPDSILEHALPTERLARLYQEDDWDDFTRSDPNYLQVGNHQIPYVVFENEDDVTTQDGEALFMRLEESLGRLWILRQRSGAV